MNNIKDPRMDYILFNYEQLVEGAKKAAEFLNQKFENQTKPVVLIGILKGCIPFLALMMQYLRFDVVIDYFTVSSYHGKTSSSGKVKIITDINTDLTDKEVVIVEDIIDLGRTIFEIKKLLNLRQPKNILTVTMLDKPSQRVVDVHADYACFKVDNLFVVGFGLDFQERFRNTNYIGVLHPEYIKQALAGTANEKEWQLKK